MNPQQSVSTALRKKNGGSSGPLHLRVREGKGETGNEAERGGQHQRGSPLIYWFCAPAVCQAIHQTGRVRSISSTELIYVATTINRNEITFNMHFLCLSRRIPRVPWEGCLDSADLRSSSITVSWAGPSRGPDRGIGGWGQAWKRLRHPHSASEEEIGWREGGDGWDPEGECCRQGHSWPGAPAGVGSEISADPRSLSAQVGSDRLNGWVTGQVTLDLQPTSENRLLYRHYWGCPGNTPRTSCLGTPGPRAEQGVGPWLAACFPEVWSPAVWGPLSGWSRWWHLFLTLLQSLQIGSEDRNGSQRGPVRGDRRWMINKASVRNNTDNGF